MAFPHDFVTKCYTNSSHLFNHMLTAPTKEFEGRPHLEKELKMVDVFLQISEPDYFPPYFIEHSLFFPREIKPEYRKQAFQMILMDFINYIHIYGQHINNETFRGTDRGLIFDKRVDENIQHTNLLSTSISVETAKGFGEKIMFIATNGQTGLVINKPIRLPNGSYYTESEILFPPCLITKTSENELYEDKGKIKTDVTITNLAPPMTAPHYQTWFTGDWDYYKTHSYFSTGFANRFGGKRKIKKRTKKHKYN
jgi:hypothetical protein